MKYRKKPIVIEAIRWGGDNIDDIMCFMGSQKPQYMSQFSNRDDIIGIETLEGLMVANKGDWIIRGIMGELYPYKDDIFRATYEGVKE